MRVGAHDIDVQIVGGTTEAKEFADEIAWLFNIASWDVRYWGAPVGQINRGVSISFWVHAEYEIKRTVADLFDAFHSAEIEIEDGGFFGNDVRGTPLDRDPQQQQAKIWPI